MSSRDRVFDFILNSPLLSVIGVVCAVLGIAAYFLPWCSLGFTGVDLLTGDTGGLSGVQAYLPTVLLVFMVIILALSVAGIVDRKRTFGFYGMMFFGFLSLVVVVLYGYWTPLEDYRMIANGDTGFYLMMAACIIYIAAGIVGYSVRPLPPPPARPAKKV